MIELVIKGDGMMNILRRMFDHEYKELKRFTRLADEVVALDEEISKLSEEE